MDHKMLRALQELEKAKESIINSDYVAARKRLLEIQYHLPAFDNISGMITVCDILHSAGYEFLGSQTDYYWVLGVYPASTAFAIETQFRKFVRLLEPIKNNFPRALSALKIIHDAYAVLSDPDKRSMFDMKRAMRLQSYGSGNLQDIGVFDSQQGYLQTLKRQKTSAKSRRFPLETLNETSEMRKSVDIFSKTVIDVGVSNCTRGKEDDKLYGKAIDYHVDDENRVQGASGISVNFHQEICENAGKLANKIDSSGSFDGLTENLSENIVSVASKNEDCCKFGDLRKTENFAVGQVWATYDGEGMPRNYAQIVNIKIQEFPYRIYINWLKPAPKTGHQKKWCEVGLPIVCGEFNVDRNQTTTIEPMSFSHMVCLPATHEQVEIYRRKGDIWAIYSDWRLQAWCSNPKSRKGCRLQMVEILIEYSNLDGCLVADLMKVKGFKNVYSTVSGSDSPFRIPARSLYMFSHRVPAYPFAYAGEGMDKISNKIFVLDPLAVFDVVDSLVTRGSSYNSTPTNSTPLLSSPESETELRSQRRSVEDFTAEQIWAVYDGPDSMPRRYVVVNNVASESEICVTFLEPHPITIYEIQWTKERLPFACGLFSTGETTVNLRLSRFSHMVKCEKKADNALYKIFPSKGEIWAKYRNWSSGWKHGDFINHECHIVEIVTDFSKESGLITANLEEVPGCKTFFQRHIYDGFELVRAVPRTEMLSFSHQIPTFTVPGAEAHDIPQGSWHLEPDALPPNIILNIDLQGKFLKAEAQQQLL